MDPSSVQPVTRLYGFFPQAKQTNMDLPAFDPLRQVTLHYDEISPLSTEDQKIVRERRLMRGKLEEHEANGKIKPGEAKKIIESTTNQELADVLASLEK
jgi:hypothetical protein